MASIELHVGVASLVPYIATQAHSVSGQKLGPWKIRCGLGLYR